MLDMGVQVTTHHRLPLKTGIKVTTLGPKELMSYRTSGATTTGLMEKAPICQRVTSCEMTGFQPSVLAGLHSSS